MKHFGAEKKGSRKEQHGLKIEKMNKFEKIFLFLSIKCNVIRCAFYDMLYLGGKKEN